MITIALIWQLVSLSTFWCVAIYMNSDEGEIFYFLRWLTEDKVPDFIYKPVIGCVNCMASFHTAIVIVIYRELIGFSPMEWWKLLLLWLLVAIIVSGINGIVYNFYNYLVEYIAALQQREDQEKKSE